MSSATEIESYGLPLFLWTPSSSSSTADLGSTTFTDLYGRLSAWTAQLLSQRDGGHYVTAVGSSASSGPGEDSSETYHHHHHQLGPSIVVDFASDVISGGGRSVAVGKYLVRVGLENAYAFTASDGRRLVWKYRSEEELDPGWTCSVSESGYFVAHYAESSRMTASTSDSEPPKKGPGASSCSCHPANDRGHRRLPHWPTRRKKSRMSLRSNESTSSLDDFDKHSLSDARPSGESSRGSGSGGGMLVVGEGWTHIVEELIATLVVLHKTTASGR